MRTYGPQKGSPGPRGFSYHTLKSSGLEYLGINQALLAISPRTEILTTDRCVEDGMGTRKIQKPMCSLGWIELMYQLCQFFLKLYSVQLHLLFKKLNLRTILNFFLKNKISEKLYWSYKNVVHKKYRDIPL